MNQKSPFVSTLPNEKIEPLKSLLIEQGFEISTPPYTHYSGKKKGVSVSLYQSGKLVVQGKEMAEFIEFYLEPQILESFDFSHATANIDKTPRVGADESGKGDYFGPLVTAAVYANEQLIDQLVNLGVADSKKLTDKKALALAIDIKKICPHKVFVLAPKGYNTSYEKFQNLNTLLAWAHTKCLNELIPETSPEKVIVDRFAQPEVLQKALKYNKSSYDLIQVPRAEEDPVVAAASILARAAFLNELSKLSKTYQLELPKGASNLTIAAGKRFLESFGKGRLNEVGKLHFQTTNRIVSL